MKRAPIDLPWHDVVVDALGILDASLFDPAGLDRNEGELERVRDDLRQAAFECEAVSWCNSDDAAYFKLFDALGYITEALRLRPIGRGHLEHVQELLGELRDFAIPY